jgi:hypothetical protein
VAPAPILWIDANHYGISQPEELHKPEEFGIHSFSLKYFPTERRQEFDQFGNDFRYRGAGESHP